MFVLQVLQHTPLKIWALLVGLIALGALQVRTRATRGPRIAIVPLAMVGLSIAGVITGFGAHAVPLIAWAAGFGVALGVGPLVLPRAGATWSNDGAVAAVDGSWLPLAMILGVFAVKYVAGVSVALHPDLAASSSFAAAFSLAYGLFSGAFALRARQLWSTRPTHGDRAGLAIVD